MRWIIEVHTPGTYMSQDMKSMIEEAQEYGPVYVNGSLWTPPRINEQGLETPHRSQGEKV
jgi:hypothetical protein